MWKLNVCAQRGRVCFRPPTTVFLLLFYMADTRLSAGRMYIRPCCVADTRLARWVRRHEEVWRRVPTRPQGERAEGGAGAWCGPDGGPSWPGARGACTLPPSVSHEEVACGPPGSEGLARRRGGGVDNKRSDSGGGGETRLSDEEDATMAALLSSAAGGRGCGVDESLREPLSSPARGPAPALHRPCARPRRKAS